ncbi:TPA: hypothetical protein DCZ36_01385 [Candidatus Gracilibacteria bacterium]|nr:hypothetical protein [Candidatus Gracilibacteria bacterium]
MNDFFTELDSDILDTRNLPNTLKKPLPEVKKYLPNIEEAFVPVQKKAESEIEPKAVRKREETREESHSHFSMSGTVANIFPETKPQFLPPLQSGQTRVIAIGGQNEIGKNMSMCQYGDEILLFGGGIQSPESNMLGAKYSLPNISFLLPMKQKIRAIVIMNGSESNIGGLKHLLPALGYPKVYGTKLTIALIGQHLENAGILQKVSLHTVNPDDGIFSVSPNVKIDFFRQNYSVPDAVGMYIETPNAKLVYTGDFRLDPIPSSEKKSDMAKLEQIGARGIDLLMSDSTNSMKEGFTKTEAEIGAELHEVIAKTEGRIIIAICSSLIGRMGQIIESAEKTGRTVFLNGRGIMENVNLGQELGLLRCNPNSTKLLTSKIDSLPENNQIILTTGSQGEEGSGLYRMAHGDHPIVKIQPGDTIILSSTSTSGNERSLADIMNVLIQSDATLFTKDGMTIDKDKHASGEEQKILLNLIRPRNFMPVHGELFMRVAHKKTAMAVNILDKNIFLANNGSILDIDQKGVVLKQSFKLLLDEIIVDGYSIGVATSHVIEARAQMMKAGVVTVVFKADEKTGMLLGHLKLETRGLVYLDEVREVHKMIIKRARASYEDTLKDIPDIEEKDLIKIIRRDLETFLLHKIERNPMIIPMIISI